MSSLQVSFGWLPMNPRCQDFGAKKSLFYEMGGVATV